MSVCRGKNSCRCGAGISAVWSETAFGRLRGGKRGAAGRCRRQGEGTVPMRAKDVGAKRFVRTRSDRNLLKIRDSDRIQTCNLLIRSQVLYSVKLRSHSLIASANVGYFSGLCKFFADKIYPTRKMALWKSGMSAVAGFCGRWAAEWVRGSHGGKSGSRQGGGAVSRYAGVGRDRPFGTGRNENGRTNVLPFSLKELPVTPV